MKQKLLYFIFSLSTLSAISQVDVNSVDLISGVIIGQYDKFEIGLELTNTNFTNPYDPDEIDVSAVFTSPSNQVFVINSFYMDEFTRCNSCSDPTIDPNDPCGRITHTSDPDFLTIVPNYKFPWRVRFTPKESGIWSYQIQITHNSITTTSPGDVFAVVSQPSKGFIKVADNNRNFKFENNDLFFPIGMNIPQSIGPDYNRLLYKYAIRRIDKVSEGGGNFVRMWMSPNNFGIEWNESGLNNYSSRQNRAFDLDEIFEYAKSKNVYIQLCLMESGEINDNTTSILNWFQNPYSTLTNTANESCEVFFTKSACKENFKKRMRYIIARWGYSPNLFSYETFNELDMYRNRPSSSGFYGHINEIRDWHEEIIQYCKSLDNEHMFTTSFGYPEAGFNGGTNSINNLPEISYTQLHNYGIDYNNSFQQSYLTQREIITHDKPFFMGEYGEGKIGGTDCWTGESNFTQNQYSTGNFFHDVTAMHNEIWSTSFNGSAGTGMYWWSNHVFNLCYGGQYKYFEPLRKFWDGEDIHNNPYKIISNQCSGSGVKDEVQTPSTTGNCVPLWLLANGATINNAFITDGISTTNDDKIEVLAIKSSEKIIGWVHNKDNYWYNLPHHADSYPSSATCDALNTNQPVLPSSINLQGEKITIHGVPCDGTYKVEFYSTYPEYDINNDNIKDQGGIIPSLTIQNIPVHCGELTFEIPQLSALTYNYPNAPDYGFKITKTVNGWTHNIISGGISENISGNLATGDNDIFYEGVDNRLHHLYYGNYNNVLGWHHEWLTDWSSNSQNIEGDIAFAANDVFYKGSDDKLHHYYYGTLGNVTGWHHEWLTDWSNNSQNVGGDIAFSGQNVFYKGVDERLHHYYYGTLGNVTGWHHEWLTDWSNNSQNINGDIQISSIGGEHVFYKGVDERLHHYYFDNTWHHTWLTNWSDNSQNIIGSIGISEAGDRVFYKGADSRLHYYYFNNGWQHTWITDWSNSSQNVNGEITVSSDGSHVFYRGYDNYIHQQYSIGNSNWGHDLVLCTNYLQNIHNAEYQISGNSNKIYFSGIDNKVHSFEHNTGCDPQPLRPSNNSDSPLLEHNEQITKDNHPYPNPFINEIIIDNNQNFINYELLNTTGTIILKGAIYDESLIINTQNLSNGMYLLKLHTKENKYTYYKMLKKSE